MAARVGEAFSYGPYFRVIKRVDRDVETLNLRVEIELDATLWSNWDRMGYVMHPTMLDGVLQVCLSVAGILSVLAWSSRRLILTLLVV